jgi:hypothetical protein
MSNNHLPELLAAGQEVLALLALGEVQTAEKLIDHYLNLFESVFLHTQSGMLLDVAQQQALQQFQIIHDQIEHAKGQTKEALWQFSKAGRVSDLYKLNAG